MQPGRFGRYTNVAAMGGAAGPYDITFVNSSTKTGVGTTNPSCPYPATVTAGNMLVLEFTTRDSGTNIPTPSDWADIASTTGGSGADGPDSGNIRTETFYRVADGTETGSVSVTAATTAHCAVMRQYSKAGGVWSVASTTGSDSTPGTSWSATGSSWSVQAKDAIICATGVNTDTAVAQTSVVLTMTGLTGSPVSMGNEVIATTTSGNDAGCASYDCFLTGSATAAPVHTMTFGTSGANSPAGVTHFIRLRAS